MKPLKIVNHSKTVLVIAKEKGWLIGARYTNTRDIKTFDKVDFVDIDWKNYNFNKHLEVVKRLQPKLTVALDILEMENIDHILSQAEILADYCEKVIVVPKAIGLTEIMEEIIPLKFILGYSVPTRYGGTEIPIESFIRPVHLLGGRPDVQKGLSKKLNVFSLDCNRFTLDARYGDFFDGNKFIPHPDGGYLNCIKDSISNINLLWN